MQIRLDRFFLDEKDLFAAFFGVFLLAVYFFKVAVTPFRFESLLVIFLFLLTTRSMVSSLKYFNYVMIAVLGLIFSTFLSPYGLLIYFLMALILYKKTNLV